jgi:hypothetical protein
VDLDFDSINKQLRNASAEEAVTWALGQAAPHHRHYQHGAQRGGDVAFGQPDRPLRADDMGRYRLQPA